MGKVGIGYTRAVPRALGWTGVAVLSVLATIGSGSAGASPRSANVPATLPSATLSPALKAGAGTLGPPLPSPPKNEGDWLYFRPVECIIAPLSGTAGRPTSGVATSKQICDLSASRQKTFVPPSSASNGNTLPAYDTPKSTVLLAYYAGPTYGRFVLGPAEVNGSIVDKAAPKVNAQTQAWQVDLTFTQAGSTIFDKYAALNHKCYTKDKAQPPFCAYEAVDVNGTIWSAPALKTSSYSGFTIVGYPGDPLTQAQADQLVKWADAAEHHK